MTVFISLFAKYIYKTSIAINLSVKAKYDLWPMIDFCTIAPESKYQLSDLVLTRLHKS